MAHGKDQQAYLKLRRHLDRQAVGFPSSRSGAEIRILKHIFTPLEAEVATSLSFRFEPLEAIFSRAQGKVADPEELARMLDGVMKKGGIEARTIGDTRHYCLAPLVVGMYEFQLDRLTPEFVHDFSEYTSNLNFGLEFLGTSLPQMRTIPVSRSLKGKSHVSPYDEACALVNDSRGPFVIMRCICREKASMQGNPCQVTGREETCLAMAGSAESILLSGKGREIDREETLAILRENEREGLVFQPSNTAKAEFICSCCGCCCGMLSIHKHLPRPLDFWAANYHASVNLEACNGCGTCGDRCQVDAVQLAGKPARAEVNRARCIGCGLCVTTCPREAIELCENSVRVDPPKTREELYDIIFRQRKGPLGKLRLVGKLLKDAVSSRDFRLVGIQKRHPQNGRPD